MEIKLNREDLTRCILSLVQNQDKNIIISKLLDVMDLSQLQEIIQSMTDPLYKIKNNINVDPKRLTKIGQLDQRKTFQKISIAKETEETIEENEQV